MAHNQSRPRASSDDNAERVRIWVRGHYMELQPEFVQSKDWVLAKALTSDVPWTRDPAGALLVDCDPEAFRSIVELLKGTVTMQQFSRNLSELHHALMESTCEYLCCADLAKAFRSNNEQLCDLKKREQDAINRAEDAENKLKHMREEMSASLVEKELIFAYKLTCQGYRAGRPSGRCGRIVLTTSPGEDGLASLECADCRSSDSRWAMELLGSFQEVKECMEAIASQNRKLGGTISVGKAAATAILKKQKLPFNIV